MRKKQEEHIPIDLGDGQESYLIRDTSFIGRLIAKKFHRWINVQGQLTYAIENRMLKILTEINKDERLQRIANQIGDEACVMLVLLEQSQLNDSLYFDHVFMEYDLEALQEILEMDEPQLKSAMLILIEHGILKVDKTRNKGKYRIDHGAYQEVAFPCVLKGGNETVIIRSLDNA